MLFKCLFNRYNDGNCKREELFMYKECAKLILYRNLGKDSILYQLSEIFRDFDTEADSETHLIERIYEQIKALLDLSTMYGFDDNLWHNYLTFILLMNENSFTLVSEKQGAMDGSVNQFALNDCKVFKALFDFDFSEIEASLDINCFSIISNYHAVTKKERMYNKNVSVMVRSISKAIEQAKDENEIFQIITDFYQQYGVGMFGLNKAFRIRPNDEGVEFLPINNMESVYLNDLVGYELQKEMLVENTKAFVNGKPANNVLLYGDAGTGKSTSIKAIVNEFYEDGLRMIEIYKHQFKDLSNIIAQIKNRNYRFIIYMDDLSFEEFEIEYKFLKAVIEGGVETKPDNVLIYATSNRRHLVKETWNDRDDMSDDGLHHSDTMQEKLSLVARFGLSICYEKPNQKNYFHIVCELAKKHPELKMSEEELCAEARKWELSHGGTSGRAAQQLINYLLGKVE